VNTSIKITAAALLIAGQWGCENAFDSTGSPESSELTSGSSMLAPKLNLAGLAQSVTPTGTIDTGNPYFQSLGTNGRTCNSCHQAGEGWTITPAGVTLRFIITGGTDPLFLPHDGANAPELDVSTRWARWNAYSLLRTRAVIRVGLPVKDTSEFELVAADDPYGHASAAQLSLFRRPLPTTNLRFLAGINWDGRNTVAADPTNINLGLKNQANGATVGHAQASAPLTDDVRQAIVDFETTLYTAQIATCDAGDLDEKGAMGGPIPLLTQPFTVGINAPGSADATRDVFTLFGAWASLPDRGRGNNEARKRVAAGEAIFNNRTFTVTTPAGSFEATCSGCHNTPNVGGRSTFQVFDVGVSAPERRSPSVPLYTFRNKTTGDTIQTTDPGRALISGLWADMNKFKVPGLRGLSARPPYFHDGSANTLRAVVDHYDAHFGINFSGEEKRDLVAFLESL
jgi:cytochrome c peroxidase